MQQVERQVLLSMARHGWWRFYQQPTPDPLPQTFSEIPDNVSAGTLDQPAYYLVASGVLRLVPGADVETEYLALRLFSVGLSLLTLTLGWLGTRAMFSSFTAFGVTTIAALHPQFMLSAVSVNPDVLINLCGAAIWWQVGCLLSAGPRRRVIGIAAILAAAAIALLSKRNGIPLTLVAVIITAVALGKPVRRTVLTISWTVALLAVGLAAIAYLAAESIEPARRLVTFWNSALAVRRPFDESSLMAILPFMATAIDTSWLFAGWLRFPAPDLWYWIARAVTVAGVAGAICRWRRSPVPRAIVIALLFLGIHAGVLLGVAFLAAAVPQGRYLFGALFPAATVIWSGLMYYVKPAFRQQAVVGIVSVIAGLDLMGFLLVIVPAYSP